MTLCQKWSETVRSKWTFCLWICSPSPKTICKAVLCFRASWSVIKPNPSNSKNLIFARQDFQRETPVQWYFCKTHLRINCVMFMTHLQEFVFQPINWAPSGARLPYKWRDAPSPRWNHLNVQITDDLLVDRSHSCDLLLSLASQWWPVADRTHRPTSLSGEQTQWPTNKSDC